MGSCADSNSDPEEDFPVYGFLQPGRWPSRPRTEKADPVVLDGCDADEPRPCFPPATADPVAPGSGGGAPDVIMLGSDSEEDDAPYTPLALRLKRRHGPAVSTSGSAAHALQGPLCCAPGPEPSPPGALNVTEETAIPRSWPPPKRKPPCVPTEEIQPHKKQRAARERQHKGVDKEAHRLELEKQKAERKALAEAAKALRPEECIKHVVAVVDPALLQLEGGGALLTTVQALSCSCAIEKQPLPRSVGWVRRVPGLQPGELASVPEAHVVMQVTVDDLITLIHNHTQELKHGRTEQRPTLTSWVRDLQVCNPDRDLNLVVVDLEKYFRSQKSQSQKTLRGMVLGEEQVTAKRRKKPGAEASPQVSRVEVEEAVVHLQLHAGVPVTFLPTWKSFLDHIAMTTKAVAEAPFKREREKTGFSFYLESEWAGGQRVDRAGKGLLQVWKRQIQQLNRVSPDMASAILAAYPSPQLLRQAYRRCRTDGERLSLLSELLIRRGEGVTSTTRRVGPELAKRLLHLMTSSDPQQNLDSTA